MNTINFSSFEYMDVKVTSFDKDIRIIIIHKTPNKVKTNLLRN